MRKLVAAVIGSVILFSSIGASADAQYNSPSYPGLGGLYPPVYDHYQWVDCLTLAQSYVITCRGPRISGYYRQPHAADGVVSAYDYWMPQCVSSNPTTIEQALPCVNAYLSWMNAWQLRRIPGPLPPIKTPWGQPAIHEWTPIVQQLLDQSGYGR